MNSSAKHQILSLHKSCIHELYAEQYYVSIFEGMLELYGFSKESLMKLENLNNICEFWNSFWFSLPDSKSIRRSPFFVVCELAEGEYLEDAYEE